MLYIVISIYYIQNLERQFLVEFVAFTLIFMLYCVVRKDEANELVMLLWPLSFMFVLLAQILPDVTFLSESKAQYSKLIFSHISLALIGYASFFILSMSSIFYLWEHDCLKKKRFLGTLKFFPNLFHLEKVQVRSLYLGIIAFTMAIGLGKLSQRYLDQVQWGSKEIISLFVWALYFILAWIRIFSRKRKDIFAYCALIGLVLTLCTFFFLKFLKYDATQFLEMG